MIYIFIWTNKKKKQFRYEETKIFENKRFIGDKLFKSKKVQKDISYLPFTIKEDKFAGNPKDIIKEKNKLKHIFLKKFF